ncbi:MAG: LLM class F420-dependent oxidoreductase [Deltaproteobacteria bacterium]|nr:LLM class F420-dependent oxidoreductase [Deltaproteobacteria bacterium]
MRFMFQYPETHGADADLLEAGGVGELAVAAERAGFLGFAMTEHPAPNAKWLAAGGHQTLDPFVALGGAATVTSKLQLLTYLAVLPYRNPLLVAKAATTVDRLSNGRFILGVGTGYLKAEYAALGVDFEERLALFDEALEVLPLHWRGEPFDYTGRHFAAKGIQAMPKPIRNPIPIWIGGNSKASRRRVAESAQGWMPMIAPEHVGDAIFKTVRTPPPGSADDVKAQIAEIRAAGRARGAELDFTMVYLDTTIRDPRRDADRHREAFARLEAQGFTWLVINPPTAGRSQMLDFLAGFGETYIGR